MLYLRRLVWFIATKLIWICIIGGMLVCGFYMCLNTANIYVILTDGLEKRADVILTQEDAEKLLEGYIYPTLEEQAGPDYFGGDGLSTALAGTAEFLEEQGEIDSLAEDGVYTDMPYGDAIAEVTP